MEIDEAGVSRLQAILEEKRELADDLAASFEAASTAIHTLAEDLGTLTGFGSMAEEGFSGFSGLALGLDLSAAQKDLDAFLETGEAGEPASGRMHSLSDGFAFVGFRAIRHGA